MPKIEAEAVSPAVKQARDAIATHIGTIQLPELLLEMDVQTRRLRSSLCSEYRLAEETWRRTFWKCAPCSL